MSELHELSNDKITTAFESISEDVRSFYSGLSIEYLENPDAFTFLRQAVSQHRPCILTGMLESWPALHKWQDLAYLMTEMDRDDGTYVNFTPNGRADSVESNAFVTPAEIKMSARTFFDMLVNSKNDNDNDAVPYLSRQNDNFRQDFPSLLKDIEQCIPLAARIFGEDGDTTGPEAINLWIGDERSVSSLHKDFFENFYCVLKGTKTFLLYPPCDAIHFDTNEYSMKSYVLKEEKKTGGGLAREQRVKKDDLELTDVYQGQTTKWIAIDPEEEGIESKYPQLKHTSPLRVEVKAGEVLYIPAMWLHRVGQTELTVSINFWHDMRFDNRYVFHRLVQALQEQL